jgi:hypothetical protein
VTDVAELVGTLRTRGVILRPDGDLLRIRPASMVSSDEKAALRVHKAEVLALLRLDPEVGRVLGLPLDQLDRVLEIRVPWWPDPLWFVPAEADAEILVHEGISRGRIWTAGELRDLLSIPGITKASARRVAEAKLAMDGDVTVVRPVAAPGPAQTTDESSASRGSVTP